MNLKTRLYPKHRDNKVGEKVFILNETKQQHVGVFSLFIHLNPSACHDLFRERNKLNTRRHTKHISFPLSYISCFLSRILCTYPLYKPEENSNFSHQQKANYRFANCLILSQKN